MLFLLFPLLGVVAASNYSYPRILIIGPTRVGKSSLGNVLAGCEPSDENCFFPVCPGGHSCTKDTTIAEANFLGNWPGENAEILDDGNVTLIDSPGFGDSDNEDSTLIAEMVDVLKNVLQEANTILLCLDGVKFNAGIQNMIEELESLFGRDRLWDNVVIEITKWAFDSKSIADRERQGITEEGTLEEINTFLQEQFHLNRSLPGVFIDSYAVYYPDDKVQMEYFLNYTRILWEAANAMEPFSFYTIEDILNQLHTCQIKNDCLNEVLEERISSIENSVTHINHSVDNLKNDVDSINSSVTSLTNSVDEMSINIDNNIVSINDLTSSVTSNIDDIIELTNDVADNAQCIDDLVVTDSAFNDRIDHFNDRLNDNTMKIVENQLTIQTNEKHIETNTNDIDSNANKIDANTGKITTNTGKISTNTDNISTNTGHITTNTNAISGLTETTSRFVSYCGYRDHMTTTGTISYDRLVTSVNSLSTGGLDTSTGIFTAPTHGTYLITQNFETGGTGKFVVHINYNGHYLNEGCITSYTDKNSKDWGIDQTGRTLTKQLKTTDKLDLHVYENGDAIWKTTFCITLLHN